MKVLRRAVVIGFLLLHAAFGGNIPIIDQLKEASKITNDSVRLYIYDQILENGGIKEKDLIEDDKPSIGIDSKWTVTTDVNPINDSKRIVFSLMADEGVSNYRRPIVLMIRYDSNRTEVYIVWDDYLGDRVYVTMRIGDEKAERFQWNNSTDNKATFYPKNSVALISKMVQVERVVFQCTPYSESPVTAVFDVRGLKEEADKYMGDLKWW